MGEFFPPCLGRFSSFIFIFTEMIGTMVLVLMGCGSAVFAGSAAGAVSAGVGTLGVAFAFGLSVVAMACAIGSRAVILILPLPWAFCCPAG